MADDADSHDEGESAAGDAADETSIRHVLVAYDGTPQSEVALAYACEHHTDARMTVLYAIDPVAAGYSTEVSLPSAAEEWYESAKARADAVLETAATEAEECGVDVETVTEVGRPATAVVDFAENNDVDHVVIGSHGRTGVSRILVGSVAEKVVRSAPVSVTVAR